MGSPAVQFSSACITEKKTHRKGPSRMRESSHSKAVSSPKWNGIEMLRLQNRAPTCPCPHYLLLNMLEENQTVILAPTCWRKAIIIAILQGMAGQWAWSSGSRKRAETALSQTQRNLNFTNSGPSRSWKPLAILYFFLKEAPSNCSLASIQPLRIGCANQSSTPQKCLKVSGTCFLSYYKSKCPLFGHSFQIISITLLEVEEIMFKSLQIRVTELPFTSIVRMSFLLVHYGI